MVQDYEYASYNPIAYDLANHFFEMVADYHSDTPHILDYSKYPGKVFVCNVFPACVTFSQWLLGFLILCSSRPLCIAGTLIWIMLYQDSRSVKGLSVSISALKVSHWPIHFINTYVWQWFGCRKLLLIYSWLMQTLSEMNISALQFGWLVQNPLQHILIYCFYTCSLFNPKHLWMNDNKEIRTNYFSSVQACICIMLRLVILDSSNSIILTLFKLLVSPSLLIWSLHSFV